MSIEVNGKPLAGDKVVESEGTAAYEEAGSVTTRDATVTTVWTKELPDGFVGRIDVTLVGKRSGTAGRALYCRSALVYRDGASATVVTPDVIGTDVESTAGYDITVNATGASVRVRATGAASHTIRWTCSVRVVAVG